MTCPHCGENVESNVAGFVFSESDIKSKEVLAVSDCCGRAFYIRPVRDFHLRPYRGPRLKDDWGRDIKSTE